MRELGDISVGRPNMGGEMPVIVYRLLEMAMHATLAEEYGQEKADDLLRRAGRMAGDYLAKNYLDKSLPFEEFISQWQALLSDLKVGILRIERSNLEEGKLQLSVYEDLDCSGLPATDEQVCVYDEGLISAVLGYYTGKPFEVKEIDCWASGERVCRFMAKTQQ